MPTLYTSSAASTQTTLFLGSNYIYESKRKQFKDQEQGRTDYHVHTRSFRVFSWHIDGRSLVSDRYQTRDQTRDRLIVVNELRDIPLTPPTPARVLTVHGAADAKCIADTRGKSLPAQYPSSPVCSRHDKGGPAFADAPCLAPTKVR